MAGRSACFRRHDRPATLGVEKIATRCSRTRIVELPAARKCSRSCRSLKDLKLEHRRRLRQPQLERHDQPRHHRQGRAPDHGRLGPWRVRAAGMKPGVRTSAALSASTKPSRCQHRRRHHRVLQAGRSGRRGGAEALASLMISPAVQARSTTPRARMPVRADVDMSTADTCMQKALKAVSSEPGSPSADQPVCVTEDTKRAQNADRPVLVVQSAIDRRRTLRPSSSKSSGTPTKGCQHSERRPRRGAAASD